VRVYVVGATGFIGRRVCRALVRDGHHVVALSRNAQSAKARLPYVPEILTWDPGTAAAPGGGFEGADAVVNLAGESVAGLWTKSKKRRIRDSRVVTTRRVVSAIERAPRKPRLLVSASGVGIYGDRGDEVITESTPPGAGFTADLCVSWEREASRASEDGLRVVLLRIGVVLGAEGGALPALLPAAKLGLLGRLGSGKQWWSWIHIEDVVGMVRFALANEVEGPLNTTSPNPVRQKEFASTLGRLIGRPSFLVVPGFLMALGGEFSKQALESARVLPRAAVQAGYKYSYPDLLSALSKELGRI
jgi:uncharacterized protein (TIGR01777 family)